MYIIFNSQKFGKQTKRLLFYKLDYFNALIPKGIDQNSPI